MKWTQKNGNPMCMNDIEIDVKAVLHYFDAFYDHGVTLCFLMGDSQ